MATFRRLLCLSLTGYCLSGAVIHAERLPLKSYSTHDGLPHNQVNRIVRDSRGFVWFCTADGLSRFDGYAFRTFAPEGDLPGPSVTDMLETRRGVFWLATSNGLVQFNPRGTRSTQIVSVNATREQPPMFAVVPMEDVRSAHVLVIRELRDGTLVVGTKSGVYRLAGTNGQLRLARLEVGLPLSDVEGAEAGDVLEDDSGALWIASPSGLYVRRADGRTHHYTERDGLPSRYLYRLLKDRHGRVWVGSRMNGLFRFRPTAASTLSIDLALSVPEIPHGWIAGLFEAADGRIWVATARGLVEVTFDDQARPRLRTFTTRNGLTDPGITAVADDSVGNLWVGTESTGAMKLARGGFLTYDRQDGIVTINSIFDGGSGTVCFRASVIDLASAGRSSAQEINSAAFEPRLGCLDDGRFEWFWPPGITKLVWGWVAEGIILRARNGEWWVGTGRGLYRYAPVSRMTELRAASPLGVYTGGLASPQIYRLFEDSRQRIWVSTFGPAQHPPWATVNGLARRDAGRDAFDDLTDSPGLPSFRDDRPRSFGEDAHGAIWMGFSDGVVRYDARGFRWFAGEDGLSAGSVRAIHLDRLGRLWLGTQRAGLVEVRDPAADRPAFVSHAGNAGLASKVVDAITEDASGFLYVGSTHGIDRFDPATGAVKHHGTAEGLLPGLLKAAFRDAEGRLWFGTTSGLVTVVPEPLDGAVAPLIVLTSLRLNGQPHSLSAIGETELHLQPLAPGRHQLELEFVAPQFGGDVMRYQHMLEGADAGWSSPSELRRVTYASLSPGHYRFLARAINADGVVSEEPAVVAFRILHPVWEQAWFLALSACSLAAITFAIYRAQLRRRLRLANMRTRIATDLHDDIGANLTRIALLSEVARETGNRDALGSIADIARESVSSMSDIVWAINPRPETAGDLIRRMRQHAEEVFTLRDIALRFRCTAGHDEVKLSMAIRGDVLLVFKEAISNVARHSACTEVDIDFIVGDEDLMLTVADNGRGFDPAAQRDGQGLPSMRRRAQRLQGTLVVVSSPTGGTQLTLTVPR